MNVAKWAGILAAALALGCAGQQAETRTTAAQPRGTDGGGGANETAANEQAPSQRPSSGAAAGEVRELSEVYGQVNDVSGNEIEVEPAYGDAVKLKLNDQSMAGDRQASAAALEEGDEVRVSYDEQGGDKVAIDVQEDPPASAVRQLLTPGASGSSDTHRSATTGGTSGGETGSSTGSSTTTPAPTGTTGSR